ncbi:MAG: hypothetical protein AAGD25_01495 [Cyanobacteria bacterium P01_F01_bin.150]
MALFDWLGNKPKPEPDKTPLLLLVEVPGLKLEINGKLLETIKALMPLLLRVKSLSWIATPLTALWFLSSGIGVNVQSKLCHQPVLPNTPRIAEDVTPQKGDLSL